jgi:hypothetical protein
MKNSFLMPNASHVFKQFDKARKSGDLSAKELEVLLYKALFLLEATEAESNRHESALKWGESKPYWEGQK